MTSLLPYPISNTRLKNNNVPHLHTNEMGIVNTNRFQTTFRPHIADFFECAAVETIAFHNLLPELNDTGNLSVRCH